MPGGLHGERFMFAVAAPETLQVAGGQLPLGRVLRIMHSMRVANIDQVRAWRLADTKGSIDVRLEPASNGDMTVQATPSGEPASNQQPQAS